MILVLMITFAAIAPVAAFANEADPDWDDFPFEIEGSVSNDSIATAKDQWYKIPKKYRDIVINNGVKFLLTDKEAEEYYYGCKKAIIAFYSSFSKKLVLTDRNRGNIIRSINPTTHGSEKAQPSSARRRSKDPNVIVFLWASCFLYLMGFFANLKSPSLKRLLRDNS